jgi:hypothetical protein
MENKFDPNAFIPAPLKFDELCSQMNEFIRRQGEIQTNLFKTWTNAGKYTLDYQKGVADYLKSFTEPQQQAIESFFQSQMEKAGRLPTYDELKNFTELLQFNLELAGKALNSSLSRMTEFHLRKLCETWVASIQAIIDKDHSGQQLYELVARQAELLEKVAHSYPRAIQAIKDEFGFHFDREGYVKVAETDRFLLYQVLPLDPGVKVRKKGKPVILIPPYVLGENILCFLAGERKSYAHAYADQGVPTYIRVIKDIASTPAVQDMNGEDDVRDTRFFCEKVKARHGQPVTLNGYCQGGFFAMLAVLSGELEGLVDTLITCVAPLDGSRSRALVEFMRKIPQDFTALDYALSRLPNGKPVVSGRIMSWVYKLTNIEKEAPLVSFYRDLAMLERLPENVDDPGKTACAINYWLLCDQQDMPVEITRLSFASYTIPVTADGTLPVTLFGRKLNFKYLEEKKINFQICIAEADDLVDREAALAPLDYIKAEIAVFPKGHAAIATSWSHPESKYALHTVFDNRQRGPVRFHLDLEAELRKAAEVPAVKPQAVTVKEKKLPAKTKKSLAAKTPAAPKSKTAAKTGTTAKSAAAAKTTKTESQKKSPAGKPATAAVKAEKAAAKKKTATAQKATPAATAKKAPAAKAPAKSTAARTRTAQPKSPAAKTTATETAKKAAKATAAETAKKTVKETAKETGKTVTPPAKPATGTKSTAVKTKTETPAATRPAEKEKSRKEKQ